MRWNVGMWTAIWWSREHFTTTVAVIMYSPWFNWLLELSWSLKVNILSTMLWGKVMRCPSTSNRLNCVRSLKIQRILVAREATNKPSPAETARTIVSIVSEGTLSTLSPDGAPIGTPVSYTLDKEGCAWVNLPAHAPEIQYLQANNHCSLLVRPHSLPARAVASVSLVGRISVVDPASQQHHSHGDQQDASTLSAPSTSSSASFSSFQMHLDKALYFGGLDEVRVRAFVLRCTA
jgi:hypothetical protein